MKAQHLTDWLRLIDFSQERNRTTPLPALIFKTFFFQDEQQNSLTVKTSCSKTQDTRAQQERSGCTLTRLKGQSESMQYGAIRHGDKDVSLTDEQKTPTSITLGRSLLKSSSSAVRTNNRLKKKKDTITQQQHERS